MHCVTGYSSNNRKVAMTSASANPPTKMSRQLRRKADCGNSDSARDRIEYLRTNTQQLRCRFDRNCRANNHRDRQCQPANPHLPTNSSHDTVTETVIGNCICLKHCVQQAIFCVLSFFSHVYDL